MEKFIAPVKRVDILIIDAISKKEYDLRNPEDEAAFRRAGKELLAYLVLCMLYESSRIFRSSRCEAAQEVQYLEHSRDRIDK
jgi:hypothetical protein